MLNLNHEIIPTTTNPRESSRILKVAISSHVFAARGFRQVRGGLAASRDSDVGGAAVVKLHRRQYGGHRADHRGRRGIWHGGMCCSHVEAYLLCGEAG